MTAEMKLFSTGIDPEDWIPQRFSDPGEGITPPLSWLHLPAGTQSLVLLMEHRLRVSEYPASFTLPHLED